MEFPDEDLTDCVECGHSLRNCICNISDEFDNDEEDSSSYKRWQENDYNEVNA